jgi:DNA-binding LacI/PurR family transcriptional regulator/DNA-binding transcriptional regulator YhcF (GntR family)
MTNIPLYQKIVDAIKAKIGSGELGSGDQVPTEAELSSLYGVSRITSKRALTELENEGLIYRVQGRGSFVREQSQTSPHGQGQAAKAGGQVHSVPYGSAENSVLLILPFAHNPGLGDYEKGINDYLSQAGYTLNIQSSSNFGQRKLLENALRGPNRGLIYYPVDSHSDVGTLYQYRLKQFPIVIMDKQIEGLPFPSVVSDNFGGGYMATAHLIQNHHQKIAFISSLKVETSYSIRERYLGYLKAMFDHGLLDREAADTTDHYLAHEVDISRESYIGLIQTLLEQGVTAIVAENDLRAIECIGAAKEMGLSVPDDLSIIGFDNIQLADLIEPKLTTISQNFEQMGYMAAEMLMQQIRNPMQRPEPAIVPVALMERQTVKTLQGRP